MNIRVNLNTNIADGSEVVFRSPADCSQVTGLVIYHNGGKTEFAFADAHGNNVGDIDHLFAENAVVKVILDVTAGMAFVQNADTNAYIERTFIKSVNGEKPDADGNVNITIPEGGGGYYTPVVEQIDDSTIKMSFVGSNPDMISVKPKTINLPGCGIAPIEKTEDMKQPVGIDENGQLWVAPSVGAGGTALSDTEKTLILHLFRNAAYISDDMNGVLAQLEALWGGSGGNEEPDTPDEPEEPDIPDVPDTGVSNESVWTNDVPYSFAVIDGEYVKQTGDINAYNGWARTPYLYCDGATRLDFVGTEGSMANYSAFYDTDKNYIESFRPATTGSVNVPDNAVYFVVSGESDTMERLVITPRGE